MQKQFINGWKISDEIVQIVNKSGGFED